MNLFRFNKNIAATPCVVLVHRRKTKASLCIHILSIFITNMPCVLTFTSCKETIQREIRVLLLKLTKQNVYVHDIFKENVKKIKLCTY